MIADRTDRRLVGSSCIEGRIALWTGKKVSLTDSPCVFTVVAMIVELLYYSVRFDDSLLQCTTVYYSSCNDLVQRVAYRKQFG